MTLAVVATSCSTEPSSGLGDRTPATDADGQASTPATDGSEADTAAGDDLEGAQASGADGADASGSPEPTPAPTPTVEGPRPFVVAAVMDTSNVMRPLDGPALAGAKVRIDELNDDGGLLGQPVELRHFNAESRVSVVQRYGDQLLRNPPDLLLLTCDVEFSRPLLDLADEQGWLTVSPCADDDGYTTGAFGDRNYTFGAPASPRGALAAEVALARYGGTAMVLRDVTSPEAGQFCNGFERAYRELGGTVAYRDEFSYETPEPLLDRLAERGPQTAVIVLCSHVPGGNRGDGAPNIVQGLRFQGFGAPILSGTTVDEATWFGQIPSLQAMTYISWSSIFGNDPDPAVNEVIAAANDDSESPPAGVSTVLGYDAVDAWARAVGSVESNDPTAVSAAMSSFNNESFLSGQLSFLAGGRMDASRTYRIIEIQDNQVELPELASVEG